jgi:hypothetical protein
MHSNVFGAGIEAIETSANRILTTFAARGNRTNFFEASSAADLSDLVMLIFARNDDDFVNGSGALERMERMRNHRFPGHDRKQFVEPHALAAAGRDNDGG